MKCALRWLEAGDVEALVADPRPADVREMQAMGTTFEAALTDSVRLSDWVAVGTVDDVPVCAFGVAPASVLGGLGVPWLLGTSALDRGGVALARDFLPASRRAVDAMAATYPRLINVIDARNTRAIRWLRWLGFTFDESPVPIGGHRFHVFRWGS
jgi:hypothetical protein